MNMGGLSYLRGTCVAQLVEHPTLDFGWVMISGLLDQALLGLVLSVEPAWDSPFPTVLPLTPPHPLLTCSVSKKKKKVIFETRSEGYGRRQGKGTQKYRNPKARKLGLLKEQEAFLMENNEWVERGTRIELQVVVSRDHLSRVIRTVYKMSFGRGTRKPLASDYFRLLTLVFLALCLFLGLSSHL